MVDISQNFVAFSEYMNFIKKIRQITCFVFARFRHTVQLRYLVLLDRHRKGDPIFFDDHDFSCFDLQLDEMIKCS